MKREKAIEVKSFGNNGWFMWFKAHANLHNLKVQGEAPDDYLKAANEFPKVLASKKKANHWSRDKDFFFFNTVGVYLVWFPFY